VYRDPQAALAYLSTLLQHLSDHGLGSNSEIFDGDPPHNPDGCIGQAWSVAELLRLLDQIDKFDLSLKSST
jgi:glycogen debranching enzyme